MILKNEIEREKQDLALVTTEEMVLIDAATRGREIRCWSGMTV